ncbi:MAG: sulfatase [Chitinophagaceae bacterium]
MKIFYLLVLTGSLLSTGFVKHHQNTKTDVRKPNILFAIMDDVTYSHMGAYGCTWVKTPNFDRIARNGLLFKNGYTPNAKCSTSRASIITGRNPWQLEEGGNHISYFPSKFGSFAEVLAQNGYFVGFTGKGIEPLTAKTHDGSPRQMLVNAFDSIKTIAPTKQISNSDYAANFQFFLTKRKTGQPFFFWYGGREPHRDYEFGSGINKGGKKLNDITDKDIFSFWPKTDSIRTDMLDYAFEIEYFDQHLGKMVKQLEAIGELNNTLIVVTSDNGMPFPRVKGQEYEYSSHLPLAMMWADGISHPGREIEDYISFIDFAPTFLELAQVPAGKNFMQPITGKSFTSLFSTDRRRISQMRNYVLVGRERNDVGRPGDEGYPIRGIFQNNLLFLKNFEASRWPSGDPITGYLDTDGSPAKTICLRAVSATGSYFNYWLWNFGKRPGEELYDIKKDPDCLHNLANDPLYKSNLAELRTKMLNELNRQEDPRVLGKGYLFDRYEYADKSGIHFYERYLAKDTSLQWRWVNDGDFQDLSGNKKASTVRNK